MKPDKIQADRSAVRKWVYERVFFQFGRLQGFANPRNGLMLVHPAYFNAIVSHGFPWVHDPHSSRMIEIRPDGGIPRGAYHFYPREVNATGLLH